MKRFFIFLLILFLASAVFLLWPLSSDEFRINRKPEDFENKRKFLDAVKLPEKPVANPNILVILVDDLGVNDISYYGNQMIEKDWTDRYMWKDGGAAYTLTTDNAPFRGGKITDFEGGLKIPFFMSWAGRINPGIDQDPPNLVPTASPSPLASHCPLSRKSRWQIILLRKLKVDS